MSDQPQNVDKEGPRKKMDISKLVSIIPPASEVLGRKEQKTMEKRVRLRFDKSIDTSIAKLPSSLAKMLGIHDNEDVEVIIAGKKKFTLKAQLFDSTDVNTVHVNPAEFEKQGVADNSIATIRKARR
ncbi:MAG: hypothetical protein QXS23_04335 [Desulfurococcaceae archaeon]